MIYGFPQADNTENKNQHFIFRLLKKKILSNLG